VDLPLPGLRIGRGLQQAAQYLVALFLFVVALRGFVEAGFVIFLDLGHG
jgi:hypothetical protein